MIRIGIDDHRRRLPQCNVGQLGFLQVGLHPKRRSLDEAEHRGSLLDVLTDLGEPIKTPAGSPALPTAGLVRLSMPCEWKRLESGCAQVLSINRPRELFE